MKLEWNSGVPAAGESPPASPASAQTGKPVEQPGAAAGAAAEDAIGISTASTALGHLSASMIARVGSGTPAPSAAIARSIVQSALRGY